VIGMDIQLNKQQQINTWLLQVERVADVFFLFILTSVIWVMANSICRGLPNNLGKKDQYEWGGFKDQGHISRMLSFLVVLQG
jgi:hypothetical protein